MHRKRGLFSLRISHSENFFSSDGLPKTTFCYNACTPLPHSADVIWTCSPNGYYHLSRDGGAASLPLSSIWGNLNNINLRQIWGHSQTQSLLGKIQLALKNCLCVLATMLQAVLRQEWWATVGKNFTKPRTSIIFRPSMLQLISNEAKLYGMITSKKQKQPD